MGLRAFPWVDHAISVGILKGIGVGRPGKG